jgi:hypothetical protein
MRAGLSAELNGLYSFDWVIDCPPTRKPLRRRMTWVQRRLPLNMGNDRLNATPDLSDRLVSPLTDSLQLDMLLQSGPGYQGDRVQFK